MQLFNHNHSNTYCQTVVCTCAWTVMRFGTIYLTSRYFSSRYIR